MLRELPAERMLIALSTRNKVELRIAGKDYTVVGTEPEEYIQKVGLYIDRKMNDIMKINNKLSTSMAAVLTAINVADDYFKCRENEENLKKDLQHAREELKALKEERKRLNDENQAIEARNNDLKLELAKREAELGEVRNSLKRRQEDNG